MQGRFKGARLDLLQIIDDHHRHLTVVVMLKTGHRQSLRNGKIDQSTGRVVFLQPECLKNRRSYAAFESFDLLSFQSAKAVE